MDISPVLTPLFWWVFLAELALIGLSLALLQYLATHPKWAHIRIRPRVKNRYSDSKRNINTSLNQLLSLLWFLCFFFYFGDQVFYNSWWPGTTRLIGEVLGVLLLYDFLYYWFHRAAHHPQMMRYMHGVHHWVRNPTAVESTYLNPLEPTIAVFILFFSVWLLAPISHLAWACIFLTYSLCNLLVHSSLIFPHPAFRWYNFMVRKHDAHHQLFRANYANIFPFWDQMFGTTDEALKKQHPHKT